MSKTGPFVELGPVKLSNYTGPSGGGNAVSPTRKIPMRTDFAEEPVYKGGLDRLPTYGWTIWDPPVKRSNKRNAPTRKQAYEKAQNATDAAYQAARKHNQDVYLGKVGGKKKKN